ncbi:MAG: Gfo/Idh/MocA family oxidoreductase [Ahrensia sp.]|nr:Gfo/Idh/MocA family oxidoreductase [Ahrensia sp.]
MSTVRYGLIGAGMMGQEHIRNIALLDGAEVVALSDPDEGMRATSTDLAGGSVKTFNNHGELLSADLCDAYMIAAPNDLHHSLLHDVMAAGKPILCEKPLCTTVEHCRNIEARSANAAPIWVAMEYRYMPPVQRLLEEVAKGTAGTPKMIAMREHRFPFLEKVGDWNRFNARTGGTLVEKCCHFWDLMRLALNSDPVRVFASAGVDANHLDERYDGATPDIFDNAFVIVDFANGTRGMLDLCMFAEGSHWQEVISITGPKARVDACIPGPARFSPDGWERTSRLVISDRETKAVSDMPVEVDHTILSAGDHHGSTFFQHQRFVEMVRTGSTQPEVSVEDGLWSVIVGEAAERSARTGQSIDLTAV